MRIYGLDPTLMDVPIPLPQAADPLLGHVRQKKEPCLRDRFVLATTHEVMYVAPKCPQIPGEGAERKPNNEEQGEIVQKTDRLLEPLLWKTPMKSRRLLFPFDLQNPEKASILSSTPIHFDRSDKEIFLSFFFFHSIQSGLG